MLKQWVWQTALSREEEQIFVDYLIVVSQWGFPFSKLDLRLLVKGYLEKRNQVVLLRASRTTCQVTIGRKTF